MNRLERFKKTLEELKNEPWPIIVEGKNDKRALEEFGIVNVIVINSGKTLQKTAEETESEKVIIMTDFDRKGKQLEEKLSELFKNQGIETDVRYKKEIRSTTGIMFIEELMSKYKELEKKYKK